MKEVNVSIIVPTYKRTAEMLNRAIKSILLQTFKNYEIIVIDDNDEHDEFYAETISCSHLYKTNNNIRFIYHKKNKGANVARNTGIENSKYDILAFLDSDDEWDKEYLELMLEKLNNENVALCYSGYYIVTNNKTIKCNCNGIEGSIYYREILKDYISPTSCVIVKKGALKECGGFDNELPARQDYDMWIRICKKYQVATIKKPLVNVYRNGHDSISSNCEKKIKGTEIVYNKVLNSLNDLDKKKYIRKIKYAQNQTITGIYIFHNNKKEAIKSAKMTFKYGIMNPKMIIKLLLLMLRRK